METYLGGGVGSRPSSLPPGDTCKRTKNINNKVQQQQQLEDDDDTIVNRPTSMVDS